MKMTTNALLAFLTLMGWASSQAQQAVIVCESPDEEAMTLAAREIRRYIWIRTGELLPISAALPPDGDAILIGIDPGLAREGYRLRTERVEGRRATGVEGGKAAASNWVRLGYGCLAPGEHTGGAWTTSKHPSSACPPVCSPGANEIETSGLDSPAAPGRILHIEGGTPVAALYGAYEFAAKLGIRFNLHGDTIPDERIPFAIPDLDETHRPLFETRGIQPFHDFPEGPDWWTLDDYKAYLAQMPKMKMNFIGLHGYPEGPVGPEPLVWIGLPEDVNDDGTVKFSYPSRWASTQGGAWGYQFTKTGDFAAGAGLLFPGDEFGSPVTDGFRPMPMTPEACNEVFNRAGRFLHEAFAFGDALGVRSCIGTETPITIPPAVQQRLREKGLDPKDPATIHALYEGMFKRIMKAHLLDYYWLWTPEQWTAGGDKPGEFEATLSDIGAARQALGSLGAPFTLATSGWVLGPVQDRAALDKALPRKIPMSSINRYLGFSYLEPAYARIKGRPTWAIPWLEDDPNLIGVQLWAGRIRRDAADAHAYGCSGLLGIHWRTSVLAPNLAALAQAGWEQEPWNPDIGNPEAEKSLADEARKISRPTGKTPPPVTRRSDPAAANQPTAGGTDRMPPGMRIRPRDLPCADLYADWARAEFGEEVSGGVAALFTRLDGGSVDETGKRMPTRIPRPSDWIGGPGGIRPNGTAHIRAQGAPGEEQARYAFVDDMQALRPRVKGAGNLARFDYWLNTFEYFRGLGQLGATRGDLDNIVTAIAAEKDPRVRKRRAKAEALPLRLALAREWESMMTPLLGAVSSPGELGTIANLEQHTRRNKQRAPRDHAAAGFLDRHDEELAEWIGRPLPEKAQPTTGYLGEPRIIVPTVRTLARDGESIELRVIVLDRKPPKSARLVWRPMGPGPWRNIPLTHVDRDVYTATLPAFGEAGIEYYIQSVTANGMRLVWPATAPGLPQTVVCMPLSERRGDEH